LNARVLPDKLDERLHETLEIEDPGIIVDLKEVNQGHSSKFCHENENILISCSEQHKYQTWPK